MRIFKAGRLTPRAWMLNAVGAPLSAQPLIQAADEAMRNMEKNPPAIAVKK